MEDPFFPVAANPLWLIGIFIIGLLVFHLTLVKGLRLGSVAWKRVDYIWLSVAAIGLFGAATELRRLVAENTVGTLRSRHAVAYEALKYEVRFLSGPGVCRVFERGEFSPSNLYELQAEFDRVCSFGKLLREQMPVNVPDNLYAPAFRTRPPVQDRILLNIYEGLDESLDRYQRAEKAAVETAASQRRSQIEWTFAAVWPLLLALALALRITKVTGEIRLEA